jgi:diguanylate cyclase (GGDEF)-like protein/PAS domain S-box-containing protein
MTLPAAASATIADTSDADARSSGLRSSEPLFDATPTPLLLIDRDTLRFIRVNDASLAFYGYSIEEFLELRLPDIRPEKVPGEIEGMIARFDDPNLPDTPRLHRTKSGEWKVVRVNARHFDNGGRPAILAAVFDMTREQELQREVRSARSFLRNMVEGVPVAMFAKDAATGQFVFYNSAAEDMLGARRETMIGCTSAEIFEPEAARRFMEQDRQALSAGQAGITIETAIPHPVRGERRIRMKKAVIGDGETDGRRYILAVAEDVTEERMREAEIAHLASHDSLTGLANRWLFQQRLDTLRQDLGRCARPGGLAIHYIDLDGFKAVNDSWGHPVGDEVLVEVARRMRETVRDGDVVARFGGDEFAVLQCGIAGPAAAQALGRRLVARLSAPYDIDGRTCMIGASIGICWVRPDAASERIIEEADHALYVAKREGKGRFVLASSEMPPIDGPLVNAVFA